MAHLGGEQRESMFAFGGNNVVTKYASSTALHLVSGAIVLYGLELIFAVISAIAVLCGSSPAGWPPLFDNPWASTSLHDLWGRRWHQLFRRSFLVGGGYPLAIVVDWATAVVKRRPTTTIHGVRAKRASLHPTAIAIGTCLASGLVHNWDYYGQRQGRTPGFTTIAFFAAQGFALALEREWKRATGKTVGGLWGWLWVFFWMVIVAQPFLEDWHQLGFLDSLFVPPEHSPTRLFIIPFIHECFPILFPPSLLDRL
ncbi:hypothetical protein DL93DRAFT_2083933 [Clavulina sp. PMI_390]|nr:hypothetical protein DL93DRAFT_2083933 [Clavulina sp. PMI_390]